MLSEGKNIGVSKTLRRSHYMMTDTPSHFAWSESTGGKPIGGSPGGGSPNGAELERAKSADNTKVLGWGTEFGQTFLEFRSSEFAQILRVPRGGGPLSTGEKIPKSDEGVSRKSGPKYTPAENFNPPYLPQMGADRPQTKFVFTRVPRPTMRNGHLGGSYPLRG